MTIVIGIILVVGIALMILVHSYQMNKLEEEIDKLCIDIHEAEDELRIEGNRYRRQARLRAKREERIEEADELIKKLDDLISRVPFRSQSMNLINKYNNKWIK